MQAVVVSAPGQVGLQQVPDPEVGDGDVVVDVSLTGICGTDLHIVDGHYPTARYPLVPGHEAVGQVRETGAAVSDLSPGDRVVVDPGLSCGRCEGCRRGRVNLCSRRLALGASVAGTAAEQVVVPAANCHPVAGPLSDEAAVLAEPLACAVHAFDRVGEVMGSDVVIYGAGAVGSLCAQVARGRGANSVTVVDRSDVRVQAVLGRGADVALTDAAAADRPQGWDLVVDATGSPAAVQDGLRRVARGGTFLQVGVVPREAQVTLSPYDLYAREITVLGSMTTVFSFARALRLLATGSVDTTGFVGVRHDLADFERALTQARGGEHLKVVVGPGSPGDLDH